MGQVSKDVMGGGATGVASGALIPGGLVTGNETLH